MKKCDICDGIGKLTCYICHGGNEVGGGIRPCSCDNGKLECWKCKGIGVIYDTFSNKSSNNNDKAPELS